MVISSVQSQTQFARPSHHCICKKEFHADRTIAEIWASSLDDGLDQPGEKYGPRTVSSFSISSLQNDAKCNTFYFSYSFIY